MKSSNIGGQAVIEGVMMRNKGQYAVACRKPDGEIVVDVQPFKSIFGKSELLNIPFIRGIGAFIDSMIVGIRIMNYSASIYGGEETKEEEKTSFKDTLAVFLTMLFSLSIAIFIFMIVPFLMSILLKKITDSHIIIVAVEGLIRLVIFIAYISAISLFKDIKRVYMYHGAEHKCISCIENLLPLTVDNVRKSSRLHKRCGTSFLLFVIIISIIVFFFIPPMNIFLRILVRLALVPFIAGISYEIIRLAGNSENPIITAISKPGLMLQKLTTREPEDEMIEVGIQSVEAIFDWKKFEDDAK